MKIIELMRFILNHPLNRNDKIEALFRFAKWQINTRLNPYPIVYPFTKNTKLIIQRGMTGATQNLYCGLHEFNDMGFLLHFLRKQDLFIDIGANIGTYTLLASSHIGATTISVEPVPSTFSHLCGNVAINQIEKKVQLFNIALGSKNGSVDFTNTFDTMNHVAKQGETNIVSVPIETLDNILLNEACPSLIKIDVEGFETEVIEGAFNTLRNPELKAIIIELNGSGSRYGFDESKIDIIFRNLGFLPFWYEPQKRTLLPADRFGSHNTIYINDLHFANGRVKTAPKTKILNTDI